MAMRPTVIDNVYDHAEQTDAEGAAAEQSRDFRASRPLDPFQNSLLSTSQSQGQQEAQDTSTIRDVIGEDRNSWSIADPSLCTPSSTITGITSLLEPRPIRDNDDTEHILAHQMFPESLTRLQKSTAVGTHSQHMSTEKSSFLDQTAAQDRLLTTACSGVFAQQQRKAAKQTRVANNAPHDGAYSHSPKRTPAIFEHGSEISQEEDSWFYFGEEFTAYIPSKVLMRGRHHDTGDGEHQTTFSNEHQEDPGDKKIPAQDMQTNPRHFDHEMIHEKDALTAASGNIDNGSAVVQQGNTHHQRRQVTSSMFTSSQSAAGPPTPDGKEATPSLHEARVSRFRRHRAP